MTTQQANHPDYAVQLCPCGKTNRTALRRKPRNFLVKTLLFWAPVKQYRCTKCKKDKIIFA